MFSAVLTLTAIAGLCGVGLGAAGRRLAAQRDPVVGHIDELLPQTQCGQCGYPGCRPYAEAVAAGEAATNLCTPGGNATARAIADLLQVDPEPVAEDNTGPAVAFIDESQCIGCTRCLPACPVDAIVGAQRQVHTVLADECTGCRLCVEACPMDCITMQPVEPPLNARIRPLPTPQSTTARPEQRPGPLRHQEVQPRRRGVAVAGAKDRSRNGPLGSLALPAQLVLPLLDHTGAEVPATVAVGEHVRRGTRITEGHSGVPLHAPTSGVVSAIERRPIVHPAGGTAPCLILEADGADCRETAMATIEDPLQAEPEVLLRRIADAGVRGMGGAAFPSALKLADAARSGVDTLVVNGVECDTYLTCDETLLRMRAEAIIDGARIAARACGAERILVAVKNSAPEAAAAAEAAIETAGADIQVVRVGGDYPAGNERHIVYPATGRTVPPGARPPAVGVVCQNVSTLDAIHRAVHQGEPSVERLVTVTGGGIAEPGNYWVRVGTPLAALIGRAGTPGCRTIVGGGIMGTPVTDRQVPLTHGMNGVVVESADEAPLFEQPCISCGRCAEVCPEGLQPFEMARRIRAGVGVGEAAEHIDIDPMRCTGCSSCELVCPSSIPLAAITGHARDVARSRMREREQAERARQRHEARQAREARRQREKEEARRRKREAMAAKAEQNRSGETTEG
ncbi:MULTISPECIES: electron transport complex subunit RsxC [Halorhodospira]|uniref:electron transport complex subunit RsxC n=1 Tax=Halorhodospira TaxID=85108 RepID=UPI001EE80B50|nr:MULTISPECIES: electron transport complex subunit RsxC [Halorhodospira]MCG5528511.1 electron transport complex subunit RsxC [Halorhodospira halophila]MCG5543826.1 electron transport complex subunit RsxC [Halorhodospira sp. 9628]